MEKNVIESHVSTVPTGVTLRPRCRRPAEDLLTVSAVEQDLDAFPQSVDVLRLPYERVPLFWRAEQQ